MTANQIAAASEREAERHNQVGEEEVERHNKALEDLEQSRLDFEMEFKNRSLDIDRQIREAQLALAKATEEDRVYLESWANSLQEEKNDLERYYNNIFNDINSQKNQIQENWNEFLKTHYGNQLALDEKKLDYQKHQWDTENWLSFLDYGLQIKKFEEYQSQNLREFSLGQQNIDLKRQELNFSKSKFNTEMYMNYMNFDLQKARNDAQIALFGAQSDLMEAQQKQIESETLHGKIDFWNPFSSKNTSGGQRVLDFGIRLFGGM